MNIPRQECRAVAVEMSAVGVAEVKEHITTDTASTPHSTSGRSGKDDCGTLDGAYRCREVFEGLCIVRYSITLHSKPRDMKDRRSFFSRWIAWVGLSGLCKGGESEK